MDGRTRMSKLIAILRKIFIHELSEQLTNDTGISTRINPYMVEVQMLKAFVYLITGKNLDEEPDGLHDTCCSFIDEMHHEYDA